MLWPEHQPVEVPAQQHREVAEQRLLLDHRLQRDQHDAAGEHAGQQQQAPLLLRPELAPAATRASQSTMLPIMLNSSASNAPITAVSNVVASRYPRSPFEHAHRNAKKPRGGVSGVASG